MKEARFLILVFSVWFFITGCENQIDEEVITYPYTGYEIEFMGTKHGLTSSSSDQEFANGLREIMNAYAMANADSASTELIFDGITYEIANLQDAIGGVPNNIVDLYWIALKKYTYSVGSCWAFVYYEVPKKGGAGSGYILYTIIKRKTDILSAGEASYYAVKGNMIPKR